MIYAFYKKEQRFAKATLTLSCWGSVKIAKIIIGSYFLLLIARMPLKNAHVICPLSNWILRLLSHRVQYFVPHFISSVTVERIGKHNPYSIDEQKSNSVLV